MKNERSVVSADISTDSLDEIDEICTRFERAWQEESSPRVEDFWTVRDGEKGLLLFRELVNIELERRKQTELLFVEEFVQRFPEHEQWLVGLSEFQVSTNAHTPVTSQSGKRPAKLSPVIKLPGYEFLEFLGSGGMGTVYKARQKSLGRLVALKVLREDAREKPDRQLRFRAEAEAIAQLHHPNIVRIYEVGEHEGIPYLALEYIDGETLATLLEHSPMSVPDATRTCKILGQAISAAHSRGIIHRDLKPSNVLMETTKKSNFIPRITDFGLAKRLDQQGLTQTGDVLGTPSYMAPEQAQGQSGTVSSSVDIYALGVILYEMLTGRPPFRGPTPIDTIRQAVSEEPVPPSLLTSRIPRDLETICLQCLKKEPNRRYLSAQALVDDLERFEEGKPICARRASNTERTWKWVRRHPTISALIAISIIALLVISIGSWVHNWQLQVAASKLTKETKKTNQALGKAREQRKIAQEKTTIIVRQKEMAELKQYSFQVKLARREIDVGNYAAAENLLLATAKHLRGWEYDYLRARCRRLCSKRIKAARVIGLSPTGRYAVTQTNDVIRVWDVHQDKSIFTFRTPKLNQSPAVWFSSDEANLKLITADMRLRELDIKGGKFLNERKVNVQLRKKVRYRTSCFSPNGQLLIFEDITNRVLYCVDAATGVLLWDRYDKRDRGANSVCKFDSETLFVPTGKGEILELRARTGEVSGTIQIPNGIKPRRMALSPNARYLLLECSSRVFPPKNNIEVVILDLRESKTIFISRNHGGHSGGVFVHPTKPYFVIPSSLGAEILDAESGFRISRVQPHETMITSIAIDSKFKFIATNSEAGELRISKLQREQPDTTKPVHNVDQSWSLSADGSLIATRGESDFGFTVWDSATWNKVFSFTSMQQGDMYCVSPTFSLDGTRLAVSFYRNRPFKKSEVKVWNVKTWKLELSFTTTHPSRIKYLNSGDDLLLVPLNTTSPRVELWHLAKKEKTKTILLSPGFRTNLDTDPQRQRLLVFNDKESTTEIWDLTTFKRIFTCHAAGVLGKSISRDGKWLAGLKKKNGSQEVVIWDLHTGKLRSFWKTEANIFDVQFSSHGNRLFIAHHLQKHPLGAIAIMELANRQEIISFPVQGVLGGFLRFSPTGNILTYCTVDDVVRTWMVGNGKQ